MDVRRTCRPGTLAAAALLATASRAKAQGIFQQFGTAGTELAANAPVVIGAVTLTLGAFLLIYGGWSLYKHFRYGSRGEGSMALAAGSFLAGFIVLGIIAFAALGTATFTGGAPTAGSGAAVTF